ncbi:MAG: pyridoxal 5'-phosphate synthase glutaminase subunit PdxT [Phascolarctobacterium sp.]
MAAKIGVLAVQGAFMEHIQVLQALGAECLQLRQAADLAQPLAGLVLPGGESTVQGKLLRDLGMYDVLRSKIAAGLPVLATCAGMILLAEKLSNDDKVHFATMPITVRRNAYGRQLGSFRTYAAFGALGNIPMTFIRAPYIEKVGEGVQVLAKVDEKIVAAQYGKQLALAFHPELDAAESTAVHEYFLKMCEDL